MTGESSLFAEKASLLAEDKSDGWLADNVTHPFVNGTGVIQLYNNFAKEKKEPLHVAPAKTFTRDWAVQSLSSAAGAILPYAAAGKVAGVVLGSIGEKLELQGAAARFFASETSAQIIGAGLYDFAKAPNQGETRLGNASASVVGFALFSAGNKVVDATLGKSSVGLNALGRFGAGAVGGLGSYETANLVSGMLGVKTETNWDGRFSAMANGGFLNVAMPVVQRQATQVIDHYVNSSSWGKGVPIGRQLDYLNIKDPEILNLARENPLARVKMLETSAKGSRADLSRNTVEFVQNEGAARLGHELKHLQLGRRAEPVFQDIAQSLTKPGASVVDAEARFYILRGQMESAARQVEVNMLARANNLKPTAPESPLTIATQKAANGKSYLSNWSTEWNQFKSNPTFRPQYEYSQAATPAGGAKPSDKPGAVAETKVVGPQAADAKPADAQAAGIKPTEAKAVDAKTADSRAVEAKSTGGTAAGTTRDTATNASRIKPGSPEHLGATVSDKGINFAVDSTGATKMELLVYKNVGDKQPSQVIPMQRSGDTWHAFVEGLPEGTAYHYRADGQFNPQEGNFFNGKKAILDPYAKSVSTSDIPVNARMLAHDLSDPSKPSKLSNLEDVPKAIAIKTGSESFDWKGDKPLNRPWSETIIMEANLRGYSAGDPRLGPLAGTYLGTLERLIHAKETLKAPFTAVEFTPIMQGDRGPWPPKSPTGEQLRDSWNYNQTAYMSPAADLAAIQGKQVNEMKQLVRDVHQKVGAEVILDIVFNHTREGDPKGPTINFRGLDNKMYYMLQPGRPELYRDLTGCGNTLNVNHPRVQKLIMDTLRYWVTDYHVDGFRFDLASVFKMDADGVEKFKPPLLAAMEKDPVLKNTKLIAEPWSMTQYHIGQFSDVRWGEWNGKFRDTVRRFTKGDTGQLSELAQRISGSPDLYDRSKGRNSINFVTAHDGFTLYDLVSYNNKHNNANGEFSRDGSNDNFSWNHGHEGPVKNAPIAENQKVAIEQLRTQQMKNMLSILFLSQGVPMYLAGDEMRRTVDGNNNAWNGDKLNQINPKLAAENPDMVRFVSKLGELRQTSKIGELTPQDIVWHGAEPFKPQHYDQNRFIAWEYKPTKVPTNPLYMAFNAYWEPIKVQLPPGPWSRLVDTTLPSGQDIVSPAKAVPVDNTYTIQPRSGIVLQQNK